MLNAQAARKLVQEYASVEKVIIPEILQKVEEAAKKGETSVQIYIDAIDSWSTWENTPGMIRVSSKLESLGFKVTIERYGDKYVPRGLRDDYDGTGPLHQNYGYIIDWLGEL